MRYVIFKNGTLHMACTTLPQNYVGNPDFQIGELVDGEDFSHLHSYSFVDGKAVRGAEIPRDTEAEARLQAEADATQYQRDRAKAYPSFADQFDLLYHGGYDAWKTAVDAVKQQFPKP